MQTIYTSKTYNDVYLCIFTLDLIVVNLVKSVLILTVNFGSGKINLKLSPNSEVSDGKFHQVDILWDKKVSEILPHNESSPGDKKILY